MQHAYWHRGMPRLDARSCAAAKRCVQDHCGLAAPNTMEVFWLGLNKIRCRMPTGMRGSGAEADSNSRPEQRPR